MHSFYSGFISYPHLSAVAKNSFYYPHKKFEHTIGMKLTKASVISKLLNELLSACTCNISIVFDQTSFGE